MISFFRRALSSWIVLALLGLIMIAFVVTGVAPDMLGGGGGASERIAKVGGEAIHSTEASSQVQRQLAQARREQPGFDMGSFIAAGGVERSVAQLIAGRSMEVWARKAGMRVSDRLIDGEIASIAAFRGPTGQFDEQTFRSVIAQQQMTEAQLRSEIAGDTLRRQLLAPVMANASPPVSLVTPYAALLLETRRGSIGMVPTDAMPAGTPPSEADIAAFYKANIVRYIVPERRVIRYALFGPEQLGSVAQPGEAEVAAFYKANAATYGARETRTLSQAILPTEAAAKALTAKIRGGTSFADAARQAGFAPGDTSIGEQDRGGLTRLSSASVAAAAFAAAQGGTTDPVKSELGWHVIHVDAVKNIPGKPFETVRGEIAQSIGKQKTDEAIATMVSAIEDAIADGSSFEDIVKSRKLAVVTTPPVLASGAAPDAPGWSPPDELRVLLKTAFEASPDDDPTVETIGAGKIHALLGVTSVISAAPAPLAKVRDGVVRDLVQKRAADRARAVATAIVAKANAGVALGEAFASAGIKLPPVEKANGRQMDFAQTGRPVPPPLQLLFSMARGKTKLLPAPGNQGWFVVHLDSIEPADPKSAPGLVEATRGQFARVIGEEYAEQFANAVTKDIGVERNDAAFARLKKQLQGGSAGQ